MGFSSTSTQRHHPFAALTVNRRLTFKPASETAGSTTSLRPPSWEAVGWPQAYGIGPLPPAVAVKFLQTARQTTVRNLIVRDNHANIGGGIWMYDAAPHFEDCVIRDNYAGSGGGSRTSSSRRGSISAS